MEAKDEKVRARNWVNTINSYIGFFEPVILSCKMYCIVSLHNFFQANRQSVNLPQIIRRLKLENKISNETYNTVLSGLNELSVTLEKVKNFRDQAIAHRDEVSILADTFKKNGLSAPEVEQLLDTGLELLNLVSSESINNTYSRGIRFVEKDSNALMETLIAVQQE